MSRSESEGTGWRVGRTAGLQAGGATELALARFTVIYKDSRIIVINQQNFRRHC